MTERPASFSPADHLRHFPYLGIWSVLHRLDWSGFTPARPLMAFEPGSAFFGDPEGGWASNLKSMMKHLVPADARQYTVGLWPEYDILDLHQFGSGSLDFIAADNVLEHVPSPFVAVSEIHRVLRPGGIAVVMTPGLYPIHPAPADYWRIMPDGYRALFPEALWETLTLDMWGDAERVGYEYFFNRAFPYGPPHCSVEQATARTAPLCHKEIDPTHDARFCDLIHSLGVRYQPGSDGRCPLILWWIGRKR